MQHALSCPKGGLVITRHNELRNLTAEMLDQVCKNVAIEPLLTPLMGEELPKSSNTSNQARADVIAKGLWIDGKTAFCDVRVFNPLARCHLHHSLPAVHKKNENKKKWEYNQRIGSFTPLVFSCFGGMSRECSCFFSHTAECLANRRKEPKSKISAWIKARLKFEACCCVFMEQKYPQTLIISAKLICVPLLLREISNESLTDSFHITSWS